MQNLRMPSGEGLTRFSPPAQPHQIKNIHVLKSVLGIDNETYAYALAQYKTSEGKTVTSSKQLTEDQAQQLVDVWEMQASDMNLPYRLYQRPTTAVCSPAQRELLMTHTIRCAIRYLPLPKFQIKLNPSETIELEGKELQAWCKNRFKMKVGLPQNICSYMFSNWINKKCWQFLDEGNYREIKFKTNTEVLFFNQLTPNEASYLITRFKKIIELLDQEDAQQTHMEQEQIHKDTPLLTKKPSNN